MIWEAVNIALDGLGFAGREPAAVHVTETGLYELLYLVYGDAWVLSVSHACVVGPWPDLVEAVAAQLSDHVALTIERRDC